MDLSQHTDEELRDELDGAQKYLDALMGGAFLGNPFDGREEAKKSELHRKITTLRSELDKRNAPWS